MVYALKGSDVEDVMVNGKLLVKDARPLTLNAAQIGTKAREYREQVQKSLR
jgi:cytosine/adenosine deaminase-related metal-dependent hydrolase